MPATAQCSYRSPPSRPGHPTKAQVHRAQLLLGLEGTHLSPKRISPLCRITFRDLPGDRSGVEGRALIDPLIVDVLVGRRARNAEAPLQQLNQRELQVLSLMAEGRSNAAIAAEAYLSESTISKHIKSIFSKLRLSEETLTHRRVAAVLTYLSDHSR